MDHKDVEPSPDGMCTTSESANAVMENDVLNHVKADSCDPQSSTPGQSVQREDVEPSGADMYTPSSASVVMGNCSASTSASFVVDSSSGNLCTSSASDVTTPLSTAGRCNDCTHVAKCHNLRRVNNRLKTKVYSLEEEVSSLRNTIKDLESVSTIDHFVIAIHLYLFCIYLFKS